MTWSLKLPRYTVVLRQRNKVKGYEITFYHTDNKSSVIGFVKTRKEVKNIIETHKAENHIGDHIYNSVLTRGKE